MYVRRFDVELPGDGTCLVADPSTHVAAIVDPQERVERYLAAAADDALEVRYVLVTDPTETPRHACRRLERLSGARIYVAGAQVRANGQGECDCLPIRVGDVIEFGRTRLSVVRDDRCDEPREAVLVFDLDRSDAVPIGRLGRGCGPSDRSGP
ncbi:MAG TPA: hypothetical protein PLI18_10870 [Pirellulaceae bacterium]|nr:hypothetical protein [Pirellulaceae bacterium]